MKKIHLLAEHIIARIAAGEVIERPVYAVKELIENSLDANAHTITITLENAGLKKIVVTDDGDGMSKADLVDSFKPHTTSKLHDDLIDIQTLGFRGEALSSIAAVSNLTIQSRLKKDSGGTQVTLKLGTVENIGPVGMPPGTTVIVSNLFYSIPARKKFLKSERTEFRHIVELVTQYSLVFSHVRFLLIHNGRTIIDLPKNQSLETRLEKVMGVTFYNHLVPILSDEMHIDVKGYIAKPQLSTSTQNKQFLFVNKRAVSDRMVASAIKEAFGNLLESTQFPLFILFLNIPREMVDVNVHPRKEQVAFMNHTFVFDTIKQTISKTLLEHNLTFHNISFNQFSSKKGTTSSYAAEVLKDFVEPWSVKDMGKLLKKSEIGQIHNLYLVGETKNGMMLIDQHAAHERILYEQFLEEFKKKKKIQKTVLLKKPVIIDLSYSDKEILTENIVRFKEFGFEIEEFSQNSFRINKVPDLFKDRELKTLILELLENIGNEKKEKDLDHFSDKMISYLACRAAIKRGDPLLKEEIKRLIEKLEETPHNTTCPHGRPTKIEIPIGSLHKLFKRE